MKLLKKISQTCLLSLMFVGAGPAVAATTIDIAQSYNLEAVPVGPNRNDDTSGWSSFDAFTVQSGDTVNWNIDFAGNQQLTLTGMMSIFPWFRTAESDTINMTGTMNLLGADGSVLFSASKTDSNGSIHLGQFMRSSDFGALPPSITFAGIQYIGTVNSWATGDLSKTYDQTRMRWSAASASVSQFQASVPEPTTWAMMLLGFGFVGGAMRSVKRKQKLTVSYA
ncbi:PEPxxWA-CTERM sorting domain-containing protein [Erythrobacter sp.]|uniref:PEPxxWA-CTERM sorting domain-containing protein n=1 Tax=Erythrobacter sp. TaxID=1042 RepID=UPI0025DBF5AE|nr:PEPxxWA-CTERM sorting domain-containing protein [Erythrobacter sp.]